MQAYYDTQRKKLFCVLMLIEIVIAVLTVLIGDLSSGIFASLILIIFLLAANFCVQSLFAIMYLLWRFFSCLSIIDPIGLFITGHGQKKTTLQNILCIVVFGLSLIASYIAYLYYKQLRLEEGRAASAPSDGYSYFGTANVNQNNQQRSFLYQPNQPSTSYGGTNYVYQNPNSNGNANTVNTRTQPQRSNWSPFAGQGYRIG